jgi:selenocysteine lyase/cysteine desulfurase
MTHSRRKFLRNAGLSVGAMALLDPKSLASETKKDSYAPGQKHEFSDDADYWEWIRQSYTVSSNIINLNNGGVSPQPKVVQEAFENYNRLSNEGPSYYMWRTLDKGREGVRSDLAQLAGCSPEEIAIQRNATEALDTIILNLNLKAGDEVVVTNYDYPNMRNAWKLRERVDGIKLVWISIPLNVKKDDEIVDLFAAAFTERTKIVHITHIINWTGQILPAKAITERAHEKGIQVVLDAAHSFAHLDFSFPDIGCDYAGTSLHKWLCAPFGTGMLYVKKEHIPSLFPIFPGDNPALDDIRKYETLGTRSFPAEMAVGRATSFHNSIGAQRKQDRLKFLQTYWTSKVKDHPKIKFYTPLGAGSCAIATVGIEGQKAGDIDSWLFNNYNIHVVGIVWEGVDGVRVTPHVYTNTNDLDKLVEGLLALADKA